MKNIKLIACDLDWTLCNDAREITPANMAAIHKLRERGIEFVPATGRVFGEVPRELRESDDVRYYITSNGAVIYDKVTGERYVTGVGKDKLHAILDVLADYDNYIMLHAYGDSYIDEAKNNEEYYGHCHMDTGWIDYVREYDVLRSDFDAFSRTLDEMEMMCVFIAPTEKYAECRARLESIGGLRVTSSAAHNLEFFNENAGKGNALLTLAGMLGIDRDETAAVGDSLNDMTMVEASGTGIAVENACDALKAASDVVICSNNGDIIDHIVRYVLPPDEKKVELFLRQKKLLDTFLANHAITRAQYDKSYGDLVKLMGMEEYK